MARKREGADLEFSRPAPAPATTSSAALPVSRFTYTSLDLSARSIRLIRILPEYSDDGYLQCEMRHASVDSEYICLSYVWGQPDEGHKIIVDSRPYYVRKNLFTFMRFARNKHRLGWLWIDALCIDQSNLAERTHQVQQMGLIFSQATEVVSWLGVSYETVEYLREASGRENLHHLATQFCTLEYWKRAWITQEILLAREGTLMAGASELPMKDLADYVKASVGLDHLIPYDSLKSANLWNQPSISEIRGSSLIYLLDRYQNQHCEIIRDRVFSLLALCGEGASLQVNYEISHQELAHNILTCCQKSLCLCTVRTVGQALSLGPYGPIASAEPSPSGLYPELAAQLTLPFGGIFEWHEMRRAGLLESYDFDDLCNHVYLCDDPSPALPKTLIAIIDLEYLCSNTRRQLVVHSIPAENVSTHYSRESPAHDWRGPFTCSVRFTTFSVQDADTTNLQFSLDFLLHIASMYKWDHELGGFCGRRIPFRVCEHPKKRLVLELLTI